MSHQSPETIRRNNQLLFTKLQTILQKQNPSAYWLNPVQVYPSQNYFKSIDTSPKGKQHRSAEKLRKKSIALQKENSRLLDKLQRVGPSIRPVEWEILYESKRARSREPARVLKTICGAYEENEDRIRRER